MSMRERLREMDRWALQPGASGMKFVGAVTAVVVLVVLVLAAQRMPVTLLIGPVLVAVLVLIVQWRRGRL
jgi:hypothetical protein